MFVTKVTTVLVSRGTPLMRRKGMFEQASDEGRKGAAGPAHAQGESRIRFGRSLEATVFIANI